MLHLVREAGLSTQIAVESAGTAAYHVGERPDPRTLQVAKDRGVHLPSVARHFVVADFQRLDYVLAMDSENLRALQRLAVRPQNRGKIKLLRSFDPLSQPDDPVPDPYYGGAQGFTQVFDICERACRGLLSFLREQHGLT